MTCILVIFSLGISFEAHADSVQNTTTLVSSANPVELFTNINDLNFNELSPISIFSPIILSEFDGIIPVNFEIPEAFKTSPEINIPRFVGGISSTYGIRKHPVSGKIKKHNGVDIPKPNRTPIYAPAYGVITFSGWKNGYGNVIEINHENGYTTLIAHNSKNVSKVGDRVGTSTLIAYVGATGVATGPHMHVEVKFNGILVNSSFFVF